MIGYIYTLASEDGNIFYVGSTVNPKNRGSRHRSSWGYRTVLEIVEEVDVINRFDLFDHELYWIEQFKQWGFHLKNQDRERRFFDAPDDILSYILEIQQANYKYEGLTKKVFKNIVWDIIRKYRDGI